MHSKKTPFVLYGGDYNPEQWDDATIEQDMQLFKKSWNKSCDITGVCMGKNRAQGR